MVLTLLALTLGAIETPRVIVSRQSATVIFPRETTVRWGWPAQQPKELRREFMWAIGGLGEGETFSIVLRIARDDAAPRTFTSLTALVAAGRVEHCMLGMISQCKRSSWLASVVDGRVVLRVANRALVDSAFGLHPQSARVWRIGPDDDAETLMESPRIEYTKPLLPLPDSARIAAARYAAREDEAGSTRITYYIGAEHHDWGPLWIAVGDTEEVYLGEMTCRYDNCLTEQVKGGTFRIGALRIARVLPPRAASDRDSIINFGLNRVVGVSPGETTISVDNPASSRRRTAGALRIERPVVVTPRVASIRIVPRLVRLDSARLVTISVNAIDRTGGVHRYAPATIVVINEGDTTHYSGSKVTRKYGVGRAIIIASFRKLADTLRFTVVPPTPAPRTPPK
jgi:hypothetical protein